MSGRCLAIFSLLSLYFKHINDWVKRRKLFVRHAIMKRHSKWEFCVLLITNWSNLILGMFSRHFIIFNLHNVCSQQNFKKHVFNIISTWHICHACHIFYLTEMNCYQRRAMNCRKDVTDWLLNVQEEPQLLFIQVRKFYCFRLGRHILFKYAWYNHLRCPMMVDVPLEK